ncbi:hypothetical protein TIFTF001_025427 [Ficus carica]|uniref:Uncharacterized protein n=1 Tax=Ficus carica TaxID=3494 RepID=A0AA88AIY1_FICCA|nr:hypothetical protein TIFTF001_025427 [Ficus carica]
MKEGNGRGLQNKVENLPWLPRKVQLPTAASSSHDCHVKVKRTLALRQKGQKKGKRPKDTPVAVGKNGK